MEEPSLPKFATKLCTSLIDGGVNLSLFPNLVCCVTTREQETTWEFWIVTKINAHKIHLYSKTMKIYPTKFKTHVVSTYIKLKSGLSVCLKFDGIQQFFQDLKNAWKQFLPQMKHKNKVAFIWNFQLLSLALYSTLNAKKESKIWPIFFCKPHADRK